MDNYNPPLEYTQLETPAIYVYGENTDLTFTKTFYFQNGKLIFMLYHCNSEGEDYDWFYENALLFMSKFIDGSGAEAVGEESKDFGYTVSGYFKRASFDTQGAYYRIIYQNSGALNEIGLASYQSNLSASSAGELALSLSIELSF